MPVLLWVLTATPAWAGHDPDRPFAGTVLLGGLAAHADLDPDARPYASPMGGLEGSVGGPDVCVQFGADTAPMLWIGNGFEGVPRLLSLNVGVTAGTRRWHVGPYGSLGYAALSAGVRTFAAISENRRTAVEVRAGWTFAGPGPEAAVLLRVKTGRSEAGP